MAQKQGRQKAGTGSARRSHQDAASGREQFVKALESTDEIKLTVIGRVSHRPHSNPVWFVLDGKTLYLLPVTGSESQWYQNVQRNPTIGITAKGVHWDASAKPITAPTKVREVVEKFRVKYGAGEVRKYYSKFDVAVEVPLR